MQQISDDTFTEEMHRHLKAQKMCKRERERRIKTYLTQTMIDRDMILDVEQMQAAIAQKKDPVPTEFKEQCDFVEWFKKTYPGVVIMSIRNGGYRTPKERTDQIREGLRPGSADLFIPAWLCWVEMKRVKGGVQSDVQKEFERYVQSIGHTYLLCNGFEVAKEKILRFVGDFSKVY